mmetsp:Transcript_27627/g.45528  ORF Transcript_27627/g.45528 Transcript_27627/m.45528 type:complete len:279 (+) Transcript_27627:715-1551(+)
MTLTFRVIIRQPQRSIRLLQHQTFQRLQLASQRLDTMQLIQLLLLLLLLSLLLRSVHTFFLHGTAHIIHGTHHFHRLRRQLVVIHLNLLHNRTQRVELDVIRHLQLLNIGLYLLLHIRHHRFYIGYRHSSVHSSSDGSRSTGLSLQMLKRRRLIRRGLYAMHTAIKLAIHMVHFLLLRIFIIGRVQGTRGQRRTSTCVRTRHGLRAVIQQTQLRQDLAAILAILGHHRNIGVDGECSHTMQFHLLKKARDTPRRLFLVTEIFNARMFQTFKLFTAKRV